jgi:ABC-2 type transport system ATP-binding protein
MTVQEYLLFIAGVHELPATRRDERLNTLLNMTELAGRRHQIIRTLSRGFKQRLGLVQALLHDPELLILDEPTSGLDPNQIVEIRTLIRTLGKTKTVILSTHQLAEVEAVCNRVLIIHQGKLVMDGSIDQALRQAAAVKALWVNGQGAPASVVREILKANLKGLRTIETVEEGQSTWKLRLIGDVEALQKQVFQLAVDHKWTLSEIRVSEARLEQVFRQFTQASEPPAEDSSAKSPPGGRA